MARLALAVALGVTAALGSPTVAAARLETHTLRYGPIPMGDFNVALPKPEVRAPGVDGHIVRMSAGLVDARGRRVTIRDVMLHHVVFRRRWSPRARRDCTSSRGEAFYGTGEENQALRLPPGYGYRIRARDRWRMTAMLMSHSRRSLDVYIRYRVTVDTTSRLTPVRAYWLRAQGCTGPTSYTIAGGGAPGSTHLTRLQWRVPFSGRIVAAGGHLHGGAKDLWLSQPRCADRRLLGTPPYYGMPDHLYYRAQPTLHEPGPVETGYFLSGAGIPVEKGETLTLSAAYEAERPRPRVMAVMHVYVAHEARSPRGCEPLPADRRELRRHRRVRTAPPAVTVPLTGIDARGRTYTITMPPWPLTPLGDGAVVGVRDEGFVPPYILLPAGARLTWRFPSATRHNVTLASGPRAIGTATLAGGAQASLQLVEPGRYRLFCYLHPVTMHQVIDVGGVAIRR